MLNSANCTFCDNVGWCEIVPRLYPTTFLHKVCLFLICHMYVLSHVSEITCIDMKPFYGVHTSLLFLSFFFILVFWVHHRALHLMCALSYLNKLLCNWTCLLKMCLGFLICIGKEQGHCCWPCSRRKSQGNCWRGRAWKQNQARGHLWCSNQELLLLVCISLRGWILRCREFGPQVSPDCISTAVALIAIPTRNPPLFWTPTQFSNIQ